MQNKLFLPVTFFVLSLSFGSAFNSSCVGQQEELKVVGVRIVGEGYGKTQYGSELRAFNWEPGTNVAILLSHPSGGLIEIDQEKSVISKWTDDKDRNVLTKKSKFSGKSFEIGSADISKDGKAALLEISTASLPQKGTTSMKIEGELHVSAGSKTKMEKSKEISLKKGTKFELAGLKFKVGSSGKPQWGDNPFAVKFSYSGTNESLKALKFFAADGKPLKSTGLGSMSSNFGGKVNTEKEFGFPKKLDKLIVGVETWTDRSVKKVPLKLDVTLGF